MVRAGIALHSTSRALVSRMVRTETALHFFSGALVRVEIALHSSSRALVTAWLELRLLFTLLLSSRALVTVWLELR